MGGPVKHTAWLVAVLAGCAAGTKSSEDYMRKAIQTDNAPKPIGPYSQGILADDFIFLAGQGPTNPATGKVEYGDVASETKRTFENMKAILEAAGSSLDKVLRCNVYLKDINDFAAMNQVYATYFAEPYPARSTVQVARLPKDARVEIDLIAMAG